MNVYTPRPSQSHSHDEAHILGLAPVLQVLEILKERGVVKVLLHMQFVKVLRVRETLDKLGSAGTP